MKKLFLTLVIITMSFCLSACNSIHEKKAPCDWDKRGGCGAIVPMSHQDQI